MRLALLSIIGIAPLAYAQPPPPEPDVVVPESAPAPTPISVAAPPKPANQVGVTYDKGLTFEGTDFKLKITFRNQLRFQSTRPTEDNSQFASQFLIPRARMQVEGHVFGRTNRYKLELGMGDTGNFSFVRDLYVDKRLHEAPVWLRAGVWKRPFNRQELVS